MAIRRSAVGLLNVPSDSSYGLATELPSIKPQRTGSLGALGTACFTH